MNGTMYPGTNPKVVPRDQNFVSHVEHQMLFNDDFGFTKLKMIFYAENMYPYHFPMLWPKLSYFGCSRHKTTFPTIKIPNSLKTTSCEKIIVAKKIPLGLT